MNNIPAAPEFMGAGVDLAAGSAVASGIGTGAGTAAPFTVAAPAPVPRTVDAGARIAARPVRSVRRTTRAIVVEPGGDARPDRLDHELDVAARLLLPLTVDRLVAVLGANR